ncbi:unnamed protein product [Tilletia caries]|uniref:Nucleoporin Nup133/Nup155-like C-terminal domain-containing protein n=1 Tax=Tilletia caries TaxID=13290 RepID=A0ABN7INY4_9BASI|nr:hypothetical protein CF336_g28 [Tilletia laevis]CAD6883901.1 unnamed protein product [Tilletia caries]CAD6928067.1 unnamed protein product [Tilletia controversa]CAD6903597.1 unnamed protein product [Tilletia caries]CAD6982672.1 unnamed protein product [Tilletia controversa]
MYASPIPGNAVSRLRRNAAAAQRTRRSSASTAVRSAPAATTQQLLPGAVLLNDGVTTVSVNSAFPAEVRQELAHVDPYTDPFSGYIDSTINYAVLVTRRKVLVWNHLARGVLPSTCFRLSLAAPASSSDALPLVVLAPSPSGREPGVIVVFPNGSVSFIESVAAAEEVEDGQQVGLMLVPNEAVTVLRRYGMYSIAIATSHSRLFRLSIVLQDGRRVAQAAPFVHTKGLLGRLFGSSSTYGLSTEPILSLALGEGAGIKLLYALSPTSVQRWHLVEGGVDSLAVEQEVRSLIVIAVQQSREAASTDLASNATSISLLDCAVTVGGGLAVLFAERTGSSAPSSSGIAILNFNPTTSSLHVAHTKILKGIFEIDSRPEFRPRLIIPHGGSAAFVILSSSLTACLLDSDFEFQVVLKNQNKSRIFGVGYQTTAAQNAGSAGVALLTTSTPPLLVHVQVSDAEEQDERLQNAEDRDEANTIALQSFVRQAVLYGQQPTNPLAFILSASHDGDFATAVERLSDEFMTTDNSDVAAVMMDVRSHLAVKKEKIAALIAFVRQSGQLGKLPAASRRKLCADAELIDAATACYTAHDAGVKSNTYKHMLGQAISAVMGTKELDPEDDFIRTFFRKYVVLLPDVFAELTAIVRTVTTADVQSRTVLLSEVNQIVLAAYIAGTRRHELSATSYDLSTGPVAFEGWSFQISSLDLLELLYHATERLIADRSRELGSTIDAEHQGAGPGNVDEARRVQRELKTHLCDLADYTLSTFEDRLLYLVADTTSPEAGEEHVRLERRYKNARPAMIVPLVQIGRQDKAFQLAERHADYQTLTKLCQEASGGALKDRASRYVQTYGESFAFELYQWHIEHDRTKDLLLLGQDEQQGKLLHGYLEKTGNTRIAWLQQLRMQQYWGSSASLLKTVKTEPDLRSRKLMLSISKLAYAAVLDEDSLSLPEAQSSIKTISENMDLVATQVRLLGKLKTYLVTESEHDVDAAAKEITVLSASRLQDYPAFATLFAQACKKLWNHQAVNSEELIDLFTLRDCADDEVSSYISALEIFVRATDDPTARRVDYLRAIWRRIILHDEWNEIADTEGVDDETIHASLRRTALYYVMKTIKGRSGFELATVEPHELTQGPSLESLRGRFENVPEQYLREVQADYETEVQAVANVLQHYEAWLQQVYRLVVEDDEEEMEAEDELTADIVVLGEDRSDPGADGDDELGEEEGLEHNFEAVNLDELSTEADTVMDG